MNTSISTPAPSGQRSTPTDNLRFRSLWIALATLVIGYACFYLWQTQSPTEVGILAVGLALGVCLYHASFGFTTAWRRLIREKRGSGIRAQMLMLGLSVILFFPAIASGELLGEPVSGFIRPLGLSVIFGAFIFGLGMQIANGCASGNLYHLGGGQIRAIPAMVGFTVGALFATRDYEWWTTLPQLAPVSLIDSLGLPLALLANLMVFVLIYQATVRLEKRHHGRLEEFQNNQQNPLWLRLLRGPWPMFWGAIGLALLNLITLWLLGRPWAVALAYPVWGAKAAELLGLELELDFWSYWLQPGREQALLEPLATDAGSLMNFGVILGAFLAATLAGKFALNWRLPVRLWIAGLIGGLLLGYGATIAFGCNIGAFVGGVVSGSLHGWLWIACAFIGSLLGTRIRPLLKLD